MDVLITPHPLSGTVPAIPSKSREHRALILAGLGSVTSSLPRVSGSADVRATLRCLDALGCTVHESGTETLVTPLSRDRLSQEVRLDVGESGSTLRFLLPVVAALGCKATFVCHGRLADRPLSPLDEQLANHGARVRRIGQDRIALSGTLTPGTFRLPGNVSSQFVSGLLMAAPLMDGPTEVVVTDPVESRAYIDLTICELARFGVAVAEEHRHAADAASCTVFRVGPNARLVSPGRVAVEGDWSDAAFWLAAGAVGQQHICISGLDLASRQGDRAIIDVLSAFGAEVSTTSVGDMHAVSASAKVLHACDVDVSGIPDLAAPLAAVAAVASGTTHLTGARRLRLKESDRLATICNAIVALGGTARVVDDMLVIEGREQLAGGTVDAANDHRIAMMAAVCAAYAAGPTTIRGAACVAKSHPGFFDDFRSLGGRAHEEEAPDGI